MDNNWASWFLGSTFGGPCLVRERGSYAFQETGTFNTLGELVALVQRALGTQAQVMAIIKEDGMRVEKDSDVYFLSAGQKLEVVFANKFYWVVTIEQRREWGNEFTNIVRDLNGKMTGDQARNIFTTSLLSNQELAMIWDLADVDKDSCLNFLEYMLARFLIQARQQNQTIPKPLPQTLIDSLTFYNQISPSSLALFDLKEQKKKRPSAVVKMERQKTLPEKTKNEKKIRPSIGGGTIGGVARPLSVSASAAAAAAAAAAGAPPALYRDKKADTMPLPGESLWVIPKSKFALYSQVFNQHNDGGFITGSKALELFSRSGLDRSILAQVWSLASINNGNSLDATEFKIAMHLITNILQGAELPATTPPELIESAKARMSRSTSTQALMFEGGSVVAGGGNSSGTGAQLAQQQQQHGQIGHLGVQPTTTPLIPSGGQLCQLGQINASGQLGQMSPSGSLGLGQIGPISPSGGSSGQQQQQLGGGSLGPSLGPLQSPPGQSGYQARSNNTPLNPGWYNSPSFIISPPQPSQPQQTPQWPNPSGIQGIQFPPPTPLAGGGAGAAGAVAVGGSNSPSLVVSEPEVQIGSLWIDPNGIQRNKVIGAGSFARVWCGIWNGEVVAIKDISYRSENEIDMWKKEVKLLLKLQHANYLVRIKGYCTSQNYLTIVMEFMDGGSLFDLIHSKQKKCTWNMLNKVRVMRHIAKAIESVHQENIIHRDIKSMNILLDRTGTAKLTDLGCSRLVRMETMTKGVGSPLWMAPEVARGQSYSFPCDIFSFGVVCFEIFNEVLPEYDMANQLVIIPNDCIGSTVIKQCTQIHPERRPTATMLIGALDVLISTLTVTAARVFLANHVGNVSELPKVEDVMAWYNIFLGFERERFDVLLSSGLQNQK